MKAMSILFTTVLISISTARGQTDTVIDNRDGQRYSTVVIGNKIWFREHLRYKTDLSLFNFKFKRERVHQWKLLFKQRMGWYLS